MRIPLHSIVLTSALAASSVFAADTSSGANDIVGTWRIVASIPGNAPVCSSSAACIYPALATVTSDGTVMQTSPISNTLTGHGVWERTGPRTFRLFASYFRVAGGVYQGVSNATTRVTVSKDGTTAEGTFTAVVLDTLGNTQFQYAGSVTAQRMTVD